MSEDVSRRRCFPCLAAPMGRHWASRYRECWSCVRGRSTGSRSGHSGETPLRRPPAPLRPPEHAGGIGGHRPDAPLAIHSDAPRATVNLLRPLQQLQQLRRNSGPRREILRRCVRHQLKRTRKAMLSSPLSVRETRGLLYLLPRVLTIREGLGFARSH